MKKLTRKQAINLKCLDCSNNQIKEIKLCTITECPLYSFRPYQKKERRKTGLPKEHYFKTKEGKKNESKE